MFIIALSIVTAGIEKMDLDKCTCLAANDESEQYEGEGAASPEEAAAILIAGLQNQNLKQIESAYAVETFSRNLNFEENIYRMQMWNADNPYCCFPEDAEIGYELNVGCRLKKILTQIRYLYMWMSVSEENIREREWHGSESIEEYEKQIFGDKDNDINIEFDGTFYDGKEILENLVEMDEERWTKAKARYGASHPENIKSVAALLYINGQEYMLFMDTVQHGDKWYVEDVGGIASSFISMDATKEGLISLKDLDISVEELQKTEYLAGQTKEKEFYEGNGAESPEEAAKNFIEGLRHHDLKKMESAYAIETFCKNLDFETYITPYGGWEAIDMYFPNEVNIGYEQNIVYRKEKVLQEIEYVYMSLIVNDESMDIFELYDGSESLEEFEARVFPGKNRAVKVNFEGIFLDPEGVLEQYANYDPEQYKALQKSRYGCNQPEDIETVMVLVAVDGQNYLMGMDMLQYNEKWYVGSIMGSSGMHVIGLRERESLLIPLEDLDIDLSRVKMYSVEKGEKDNG